MSTIAVKSPRSRSSQILVPSWKSEFKRCGDLRLSPAKRVASAVGEGSMAIAFVHRYLANEGQAQPFCDLIEESLRSRIARSAAIPQSGGNFAAKNRRDRHNCHQRATISP
jgi:hypothetical protein